MSKHKLENRMSPLTVLFPLTESWHWYFSTYPLTILSSTKAQVIAEKLFSVYTIHFPACTYMPTTHIFTYTYTYTYCTHIPHMHTSVHTYLLDMRTYWLCVHSHIHPCVHTCCIYIYIYSTVHSWGPTKFVLIMECSKCEFAFRGLFLIVNLTTAG